MRAITVTAAILVVLVWVFVGCGDEDSPPSGDVAMLRDGGTPDAMMLDGSVGDGREPPQDGHPDSGGDAPFDGDGPRGEDRRPEDSSPDVLDCTSCADPQCEGQSCGEHGQRCQGGVCTCPDGEEGEQSCSDGRDNDCDGLPDCFDEDCEGRSCVEGGESSCSEALCQRHSSEPRWAIRMGDVRNSSEDAEVHIGDMAALPDGGFLATGSYLGEVTFGSGEPGEVVLRNDEPYTVNFFLARYGADGSLRWAKRGAGVRDDYGNSIAVLPDSSCLVLGEVLGEEASAVFGEGEVGETVVSAPYGFSFVAHYLSDGRLNDIEIVARRENADSSVSSNVITVYNDRIYIYGVFYKDLILGWGGKDMTLSAPDSPNMFLSGFDLDRELLFAMGWGGENSNSLGYDLCIIDDRGLFASGHFGDTLEIGRAHV